MMHIRLDEIDSTNDYAYQLASKSKPDEGTVISAAYQYAGKGQYGRTWTAKHGANATFSLILYPQWLPLDYVFLLNLCLALGCLEGLISITRLNTILLKWPNDLFIGDQKLGGMLLQNTLKGKKIDFSIMGFGINVNQELFPPEIIRATSLKVNTGADYDINELIEVLCPFIMNRYDQLKTSKDLSQLFEEMKQSYLIHLYRFSVAHEFYFPDGTSFKGTIVDLLLDGRIMILHPEAQDAVPYDFRQISFFRT